MDNVLHQTVAIAMQSNVSSVELKLAYNLDVILFGRDVQLTLKNNSVQLHPKWERKKRELFSLQLKLTAFAKYDNWLLLSIIT